MIRQARWEHRKPGRSSGRMGSRCGYLARFGFGSPDDPEAQSEIQTWIQAFPSKKKAAPLDSMVPATIPCRLEV